MQFLFLIGLLSVPAFAAKAKRDHLDACRIDLKSSRVTCQEPKGFRSHSIKKVDRWIAVPCKQLRKHIPSIRCNKSLGELRLGEPLNE